MKMPRLVSRVLSYTLLVSLVLPTLLVPRVASAQTPAIQPVVLDSTFKPVVQDGMDKCRAGAADTLGGAVSLASPLAGAVATAAGPSVLPDLAIGALDALSPSTAWVPVLSGANGQEPAPVIAEGTVYESFVNYYDSPYAHESHDQNLYVNLDPAYSQLNSPYNADYPGIGKMMEMEWETKYFAKDFWPMIGDRVWLAGRYIWDCGHPPQLHTELHPPEAIASTRFAPTVFDGDPQTHPSVTNKTFFYASNNAGFYGRIGRPHDVAGRVYEFDVPLPPRPSASAVLTVQTQSSPSLGQLTFQYQPKPADSPNSVHMVITPGQASPDGNYGRVFVVGWREPVPTQGFCRVKITLDYLNINDPHTEIMLDLTGGYAVQTDGPTPWQLWGRVGDTWQELLQSKAPGLPPSNAPGLVRKGDSIPIHTSSEVIVPQSPPVSSTARNLPQNKPLTISTVGWKSGIEDGEFGKKISSAIAQTLAKATILRPLMDESSVVDALVTGLTDGQNSIIGWVNKSYTGDDNYGLGQHSEDSMTPVTYPFLDEKAGHGAHYQSAGDFTLQYHIDHDLLWCTPVITSFAPTTVREGDTLRLTGRYFETVDPTKNIVVFKSTGTGTVEAPATKATAPTPNSGQTDWTLEVKVPPGVASGPIQLRTPSGEFTTANGPLPFRTLNAPLKPVISSFQPTQGKLPLVLTVTGKFFSPTDALLVPSDISQPQVTLSLGSYGQLSLISVTDTQIIALVPKDVQQSASLKVETAGGSFTTTDQFKILQTSASDHLPQGGSINVNSGSSGMGSEREMTLEKALKVADGSLGRPLATRPLDARCQGIYQPGDNRQYEDELVYGDKVMRDCQWFDANSGRTLTTSVSTGYFRNVGANYRDSISVNIDVSVSGTPPALNGDSLTISGTVTGVGGSPGITLTGRDSSVSGGKFTGFTTSGIIVRNGEGVSVQRVSLVGNGGAGILVDNSPFAQIDVDSAGGNGGPGILITGDKSTGVSVTARHIGDDPANGIKGNQRGIEISGGAAGAVVKAGTINGNTEQGVLIKGGNGRNSIRLDYGLNRNAQGASIDAEIARNGMEGVSIVDSPNNRVLLDLARGGRTGMTQASIHDNNGDGVHITGAASKSNIVQGLGNVAAVQGQIVDYMDRNLFRSVMNNKGNGIKIDGGASLNIVKGAVIAGNGQNGILISGDGTDTQLIDSNRLGGDPGKGEGNGLNGLAMTNGAKNNWAGRAGNLIIGNKENGVLLAGSTTSHNSITFNGIGIDYAAQAPRPGAWNEYPNQKNGVLITDMASENYIGMPNPDLPASLRTVCCGDTGYGGNAIGGNKEAGVKLDGIDVKGNVIAPAIFGFPSSGIFSTSIYAQYMIGNNVGIDINGAKGNFIGGTDGFGKNVIVRNKEAGIRIDAGEDNIIVNNLVGIFFNGGQPLLPIFTSKSGNGIGIALYNNAARNRIGGFVPDERNYISGNDGPGILMSGVKDTSGKGDSANPVLNNVIGVQGQEASFDPKQHLAMLKNAPFFFPNDVGVRLEKGTSGQVIGDTGPSGFNVISGNRVGIIVADKESTGNRITGNRIGVMESGHHSGINVDISNNLPNTGDGIQIQGAASTRINGNLVSSNRGYGISIDGATSTNLQGNLIGTDIEAFSTLKDLPEPISLPGAGVTISFNQIGNSKGGVYVSNSPNTIIGNADIGGGNVIRGNRGNGIWITGADSTGVKVWSNVIGADPVVTEGNAGDGIRIDGGADRVTIGGKAPLNGELVEATNQIWQNQGVGISVIGVTTLSNTLSLNSITDNTNAGIKTSAGGNKQIPPPVLKQVNVNGFVQATVDPASVPDGSIVEFFSDGAAQGEEFISNATTANGRVEGTIPLPPAGNLTATVTSAATGDTSEFATVIPIPPPPPYSFLKVEPPSPPLADRKVSVSDKAVGLIELKLSTGITPVAVRGLKLTFKGSTANPGVANASLWEDKNGNGKVDTDEHQIAAAADATFGSGFISFDHLTAVLPPGTETDWLLAGDFASQTLGQTIQLDVNLKTDIAAATNVPGSDFAVIGDFPVNGPRLSVVTVAPPEKPGPGTTPASQGPQSGRPTGSTSVFEAIGRAFSSVVKFFAGLFKR